MEVCKERTEGRKKGRNLQVSGSISEFITTAPKKLNMNYSSSGCMSVRTPRHQHSSKMMHKKYILDKLWRPHRNTEMSKLKIQEQLT